MDELQKESNLKRYQYLPPRDRYRLQKQMKADEEAERIKSVTLHHLFNCCFPGEPAIVSSPQFLSPLISERTVWKYEAQISLVAAIGCHCCYQANSVKALKES